MNERHLSPSMRSSGVSPEAGSNSLRGAPKTTRIGAEAFDTLMSFLAEDPEAPTSALGTFVANSTKRDIKRKIEATFKP